MLKSNLTLFCTAIMVLAAAAPAEAAKSAYSSGLSTGKKRGYSNPECYATVFATYAMQRSDGKFGLPSNGPAANAFRSELHSKCNISR